MRSPGHVHVHERSLTVMLDCYEIDQILYWSASLETLNNTLKWLCYDYHYGKCRSSLWMQFLLDVLGDLGVRQAVLGMSKNARLQYTHVIIDFQHGTALMIYG